MQDYFILFSIVIVIILVIFLNDYFSRINRIKRKLNSSPLQKISSFQNGEYAKIKGKSIPLKTLLTAPLSDRKCVFYHVVVEEKKSSGKYSHWKTIIDEKVISDFIIDDGSGIAMINHEYISDHVTMDRIFKSGFGNDATQKLTNYLNFHHKESENWMGFNKTIRYKEGIIEEGEEISVLGKGKWGKNRDLHIDSSHYQVLTLQPTESEPVYLSDDPSTFADIKKKKSSGSDFHYQK